MPCGGGHVAVLEQRVQRPKQVEIKGSDIHQIYIAHLEYRFDSRIGTMYPAMGHALGADLMERYEFDCEGDRLVGNLHLPKVTRMASRS